MPLNCTFATRMAYRNYRIGSHQHIGMARTHVGNDCDCRGSFVFRIDLCMRIHISSVKNVDALRSEKYSLYKMALEKNLIGDSMTGVEEVEDVLMLPGSKETEEEAKGSE